MSRLTRAQEEIRLTNLYALTNYTYCVVSSSSGLQTEDGGTSREAQSLMDSVGISCPTLSDK